MMEGRLQHYVGRQGVSRLLYYGPVKTETMELDFHLSAADVTATWSVQLAYGVPDRLFLSREELTLQHSADNEPRTSLLQSGGAECRLPEQDDPAAQKLSAFISSVRTWQFHDTSDSARIKDRCYVDDAAFLRSDGGNLAAFLKMLKEHPHYAKYYARICRHIQRVMPQFGDFELHSIPGQQTWVRLNWRDAAGSDYLFGPDQLSDGSLRFMALAALLLQPPELLPECIILDEPELGLHPAAINELAAMVRVASRNAQVVLATQSTGLVDEFSLQELVIVERDEAEQTTICRRLEAAALQEWLERYSVSELWEKNVLGGQP